MNFLLNKSKALWPYWLVVLYLLLLYPFLRGMWTAPGHIKLFGFSISLYGSVILLAIFSVRFAVGKYIVKKDFKQLDFDSALLYTVIPAIIGARIWHALTDFDLYTNQPLAALYIWHGGLGIYGALAGGMIGLYFYCKSKQINFIKLVDLLSVFMPLGHAIGRIGNFLNQELYGPSTTLPWGTYIQATGRFHHPTFLYEQIGDLLLFILIFKLYKKNYQSKPGYLLTVYLLGYSIVRFVVDFFRSDQQYSLLTLLVKLIIIMLLVLVLKFNSKFKQIFK